MIRRIPLHLVLATAIMALAGCDSSTGPDDSGPIIPLAVGNLWRYQTNIYDTLGDVHFNMEETLSITGTSVIDGETWYITNDETMMAIRADGLWQYDPRRSPKVHHLARYPAAIGDTFASAVFPIDGEPDSIVASMVVMATNHPVTIGKRTYSCMAYGTRYRHTSTGEKFTDPDFFDGDYIMFMAPGVGIVMEEWFVMLPSGTIILSIREQLMTRP